MEKISHINSKTVSLPLSDIDTDQIIPAKFLTTTTKDGLGKYLFSSWRYDDAGNLIEDFIINQIDPTTHQILVTGHNFGCGSSREHAPWALVDFGFKAVISTEIADIFFNNALKNGFIPIVVNNELHKYLLENSGVELAIDIEAQTLSIKDYDNVHFEIEPFAKFCILNGVDQLGFLQNEIDLIHDFESKHGK